MRPWTKVREGNNIGPSILDNQTEHILVRNPGLWEPRKLDQSPRFPFSLYPGWSYVFMESTPTIFSASSHPQCSAHTLKSFSSDLMMSEGRTWVIVWSSEMSGSTYNIFSLYYTLFSFRTLTDSSIVKKPFDVILMFLVFKCLPTLLEDSISRALRAHDRSKPAISHTSISPNLLGQYHFVFKVNPMYTWYLILCYSGYNVYF